MAPVPPLGYAYDIATLSVLRVYLQSMILRLRAFNSKARLSKAGARPYTQRQVCPQNKCTASWHNQGRPQADATDTAALGSAQWCNWWGAGCTPPWQAKCKKWAPSEISYNCRIWKCFYNIWKPVGDIL